MSRARKLLATAFVAIALTAVVGASFSAFTATTTNSGNQISAGTVAIGSNDSGAALFNVSNLKPGDVVTKCINVTYTGNLDANVRLYGSSSGALAPYLNLGVLRGTDSSPSFPSCSNFTPIPHDWGQGEGVFYGGLLASYPADWAGGIDDLAASGSPTVWEQGSSHAYQLIIAVEDNPAAQGSSASLSFTWEARNL